MDIWNMFATIRPKLKFMYFGTKHGYKCVVYVCCRVNMLEQTNQR